MRQLLFVRVLATSLCLEEIDRVAGVGFRYRFRRAGNRASYEMKTERTWNAGRKGGE